jgi:hypothetical protein
MRTCTLSLLLLLIGFSAIAMPLQEEQGTTPYRVSNRLHCLHNRFKHSPTNFFRCRRCRPESNDFPLVGYCSPSA